MRRKKREDNKVDLHGIRHCEAEQILVRAIEDLWGSNEKLEIITGHSPQMKIIVRQILDEYKLEYTECDPVNSGYIKTVLD